MGEIIGTCDGCGQVAIPVHRDLHGLLVCTPCEHRLHRSYDGGDGL